MEITFRKIKSKSEFEEIKSLYLSAFPPYERREFSEFIKQSKIDECNVNYILADLKIAGFIILWVFTDFVFIEHFAVKSHLRRLGIGEKALAEVNRLYQKNIILETELPTDEITSHRIEFYERNGFYQLDKTYFQPSYGGNKPEVELKLMILNKTLTDSELDQIIKTIRKKVYQTQ